ETATARGEGAAVQFASWTTAILYNGLGRYGEALVAALQASDTAPERLNLLSHWALAELVEACVRSGNPDLAAEALEQLVEAPSASGADWGLGIVARSRALLSGAEAAEPLYIEAITRLGRTPLRLELARAHLVYGEWLRRENRRMDAREQLRTAYEMFANFGADAFAERTPPVRCSQTAAPTHLPSAPAASCSRPARRCANGLTKRAASSPRRRSKSP